MINRYLQTLIALLSLSYAWAQQPSEHQASFELGSGLNFEFNDGAYAFNVGGMIQPYFALEQDTMGNENTYINARRAFFSLSGEMREQNLSFMFRTDFASTTPLLDAWVCYEPWKEFKIFIGQKQTIANNREMLFLADQLQFSSRSSLSNAYSRSGRELGLYVEPYFELGPLGISPQLAVTSGDGANSFGEDSRDTDLGGLKYAARLDLFPFGAFSKDNDKGVADLKHETKPKAVVGIAGSYNDGASDAVGEGHGIFTLYNANADFQRPDYRQVYADVMAKYRGFSVLAEYSISTALGLTGAFLNEGATIPLEPTQISEYLALGRGVNVQAGYVTSSGWGIDTRFSDVKAEFASNEMSVIQNNNSWAVSLSRYIKDNGLKVLLTYGEQDFDSGQSASLAEVMLQLRF